MKPRIIFAAVISTMKLDSLEVNEKERKNQSANVNKHYKEIMKNDYSQLHVPI